MTDTKLRLGIDFGGTKTEIIGLNGINGKELFRKRVATPRDDYEQTLQSFKTLVNEAESNLGMTGTVGIGIPGSISRDTGLVKNANSTWVIGKPLQKDLEKLLEREVRIQNDANCFTVSEAVDGAGQKTEVVFGVIIGTGCGGGITIDGKIVEGLNGITGEWGHNRLPMPRIYLPNSPEFDFDDQFKTSNYPYITDDKSWSEFPGPACYCGERGCQETWISGTGFKRDYKLVNGEEISTHDIITNARKGEPNASAALERYIDRLARSLSSVINVLDPDVIVLGGGMSNVPALYTEVPKVWGKYVFSDTVRTKLLSPIHGDSSGVRGAAWLWND
jgi:predicted NBD/HSP70 family sugar kinase